MAVQYHTHTFDIPTATNAEAAAGTRSDVALTPSNMQSIVDSSGISTGFPTITAAEAANITPSVHAVEIYGDVSEGDGLGGLYIDTNNGASETFISGDGRTWYLAADINPDRLTAATLALFATAAQGVLADGAAQKAQNLADLTDKASGRFNLKIPVYVADRTALKALDTTKDAITYLKEDGREGIFEWTAGDFSTQITADTQEGVYIKADAIASTAGAWVRVSRTNPTPQMFGAVGDGVANDTTALNAWANYISSGSLSAGLGMTVTPPSGRYLIRDTVTFKFGTNFVGPEGSARYGFVISVDAANWSGASVAVIIQAETEAFTAAKVTGLTVDVNGVSGVEGIRFEGAYQNAALKNIWVYDTPPNAIGLHVKPLDRVGAATVCESLLLENIYVIPAATVGTVTQPGILLDRCQETTLINVKGFDKLPGDAATPGAAGIKLLDCRGITMLGCSAAFAKYGIEIEANTRQSTGFTIIGPTYEGISDISLYVHGTSTNKVTNVTQIGTRLESTFATNGLDAEYTDYLMVDAAFQNSVLGANTTSVTIYGFGTVTATAGAKYVTVTAPNAVKDKLVFGSIVTSSKANSPSFDMEVPGRSGQWRWQWSASVSVDNGARFVGPNGVTVMTMSDAASLARLGFYNAAPIQKPTVTGSKGGNAALTSLMTQLAALGLVTDSTT